MNPNDLPRSTDAETMTVHTFERVNPTTYQSLCGAVRLAAFGKTVSTRKKVTECARCKAEVDRRILYTRTDV